MPIYEYHCDACDTVFEEWHRRADDIMEEPCPKCHAPAHRLISNTTFVLKGGGWYVTEYGNRKTDGASSTTASTSSDSASDAPATPAAPVAESSKTDPVPATAAKETTASAAP